MNSRKNAGEISGPFLYDMSSHMKTKSIGASRSALAYRPCKYFTWWRQIWWTRSVSPTA